jgi:hypothetical protein
VTEKKILFELTPEVVTFNYTTLFSNWTVAGAKENPYIERLISSGANAINLFSLFLMIVSNEPQCLSLASLSTLFNCLQVKLL